VRFSLIHLDGDGGSDTVTLVVPGGEKVAVMLPLDALPEFLPLLDGATEALAEQCCGHCGEALPGLRGAVN
jgi:hypothetical protein